LGTVISGFETVAEGLATALSVLEAFSCRGGAKAWTRFSDVKRDGMNFDLFSDVILAADVPERGLKAGDIGTVVERHAVAGREDGYSVEFFDKRGQTVAVATIPASALRLRPRFQLADPPPTSLPPNNIGPVNMRWNDNLLQLLGGLIGAALGGMICYQAAEIYAWRLHGDWLWQHYGHLAYLFCCVGGLVAGVFITGLFLLIYHGVQQMKGRHK
jgi:hypothetical protein